MSPAVLVVDTDARILERVTDALRQAGFSPVAAAGFEDATARLEERRVAFLVTAHRLGAHDGLHLVLRARAKGAYGTVVTTESADAFAEQEAADLGAVTVVAPWTNPAALIDAIARARDAYAV